MRVLLDHAAADVDAAEAVSGKTALHLAVERGLEVGGREIQLGQPSVNPPRLVLEVGGTSTLQAAMPVKLKSPPLQASK